MTTKTPPETPAWVKTMRRLMTEQGLNPRSLSLRAGLNATAVRDMIEGRSRFPRYDTVQALADVLNTTPAQLMGGGDIAPQDKKAPVDGDIELLTEIITRLQETAREMGRELEPREFAAMSTTIYRRLQESGDALAGSQRLQSIKPQIHDFLEYENLRQKKGHSA